MGHLRIDKTTESERFELGSTAVGFSHTPDTTPRAVAVLTTSFGANKSPKEVKYGGSAMSQVENNVRNESPFPFTSIWFLDDCKAGTQEVTLIKDTAVQLRALVVTLLADGEVTVDVKGGGSANSEQQKVSLTASGRGLGLAIIAAAHNELPNGFSDSLLSERDEGTEVYHAQYSLFKEGKAHSYEWAFATTDQNARTAAIFKDPNQEPDPWEDFKGDFETGDLSQFDLIQAPKDRITVVEPPVAQGKYAAKVELRVGDPQVASGCRSEMQSGREYQEGDPKRHFRALIRIPHESWDWDAPFGLIWQSHDNSVESPPLCLMLGESGGTKYMAFQSGDSKNIYCKMLNPPDNRWFELAWGIVFAKEGSLEVLRNGNPQTMLKGTGIETLGKPKAYDKNGIYRSIGATGTAVVYFDDYRITEALFSDPPKHVKVRSGGIFTQAARRAKIAGTFQQA